MDFSRRRSGADSAQDYSLGLEGIAGAEHAADVELAADIVEHNHQRKFLFGLEIFNGISTQFAVEKFTVIHRDKNLPKDKNLQNISKVRIFENLNGATIIINNLDKMKRFLAIALAALIAMPAFSQSKLRENYTEKVLGIEIPMVYVEGGEFMMGGTSEQGKEASKDEVIHRVTVSDFHIGQFEITQSQWEAVMETSVLQQSKKADAKLTLDKLNGVGPDYPMYYVTWEEAMEFCRILSKKTGKKYSLPTEAEWEYAARGGNKVEARNRTKYSGSNLIERVAWYHRGSSHPVGQLQPNELGIYDMSGNVWEWCYDWYGTYSKIETFNPEGPAMSTQGHRVIRGGSWHNPASVCRVSYRGHNSPERREGYRGFRIVCHDVPAEDAQTESED